MAAKYLFPSGEENGAQASWRSGKRYAVAGRRTIHFADVVSADLMPKATRARVDEHHQLTQKQPEGSCRRLIEDSLHALDLEEVVTTTQCAELI
jgi:hypothetical protein